MKSKHVFSLLFFAICWVATVSSLAQPTATVQAQVSLVGSWLVTVDGEMETRTLFVAEEAPTSDGALLEAKYGITNRGQVPINAKMLHVSDQRQLILTVPQTGTRIAAIEQSSGIFKGTFTPRNGSIKEVSIVRITEAMQQQLLQVGSAVAVQKPGPEVPESCAGFFGSWAGSWNIGNFGQQRLWVLFIKADCTARVSYRSSTSNGPPKSLSAAKIEGGALALPCGEGGTCVFQLHGDDLWGSYTDTSGGRNNAVFRKFQ
jgi:hypothetical protein